MTSMRIGVLGVLPPESGGAGTLTQKMLTELIEASKNDTLIYINEKKSLIRRLTVFLHDKIITGAFTKYMANKFGMKLASSLERQFIKERLDLVFFFSYNPKATLINFTPYVVTVWDLGHLEYPFLFETGRGTEFSAREHYYLSVLKRAQAILVESDLTENSLLANYGIRKEKISVMPFAPEVPSQILEKVEGGSLFYPAHFWSHKNHIVLLRALKIAKNRFHRTRKITFSGLDKGNLQFLLQYVESNNLSDYVCFAGFLSAEELEQNYQQAEAIIYPSLLGPTNLPPLEGLLRNRPAIASSVSVTGMLNYPFIRVSDYKDPEAWVQFFDSDYRLEIEIDVKSIHNDIETIRVKNITEFSRLINDVRSLKMLASE